MVARFAEDLAYKSVIIFLGLKWQSSLKVVYTSGKIGFSTLTVLAMENSDKFIEKSG